MDENDFKTMVVGAGTKLIFHPLHYVRILQQLGHEPYALSLGKMIFGEESYYLPNSLKYMTNITKEYGWLIVFTGCEAAICGFLVQKIVEKNATAYIDSCYPELGGNVDEKDLKKSEKDISDMLSARRFFRTAMRKTVVHGVAVVASRPFYVVMIRQVAQLIGRESKYGNVISSLFVIGHDEGPSGFFSGLIPQLILEIVGIWGVTVLTYSVERSFLAVRKLQPDDENEEENSVMQSTHDVICGASSYIVNALLYRFDLVATVMAITGSGLIISMLPYSPGFDFWIDSLNYLKIHRSLKRGAKIFLRKYDGPVSVDQNKEIYADSKYFY